MSDQSPVPGWTPRERPSREPIEGRYCRLESFEARHLEGLWAAYSSDAEGRIWDYLPYGPFPDYDTFAEWGEDHYATDDPHFHVIHALGDETPLGVASLMRINETNGVIEVGQINYGPALQRTPIATEAMYLLMRRCFDELCYRRYEWECNNANIGSRRAAARLGFTFEGVFRQHLVVKGHNRDTAWYAIIDKDWPAIRAGFEAWLDPANFDDEGNQIRSLGACR